MPGVRMVELSEREAIIPDYATVVMYDLIIEPGAEVEPFPMEHDMVCHLTAGELNMTQDGEPFSVSEGDVWTCAQGTEEGGRNETETAAIMRITELRRA